MTNDELMRKEFEAWVHLCGWGKDDPAYEYLNIGWQAAYAAALSLESKQGWHDAHLRLPEEGNREKIDEWEACYALLFNQLNDLVPRLQDEIKTLRGSKQGWLPIETCPTAGRDLILLLFSGSKFPQVAFSNTWWTAGFSHEYKPTHWMPIPPTTSPEIAEDK